MDWSILEKLQGPCADHAPVGLNLEYEPLFLELVRISERKPELQYGKTIREASEPDWKQVFSLGMELAEKTRDLRVGIHILESLAHLYHWRGLARGLELLTGWVTQFWEQIHPQLDPDDSFDPTNRVSVLSHLVSDDFVLQSIYHIPLADHRSLGRVTLADYRALVQGVSGTPSSGKQERANIEIIFKEVDRKTLEANVEELHSGMKAFDGLNRFLTEHLGTQAWSGERLQTTLLQIDQVLDKNLRDRADAVTVSNKATEAFIRSTPEEVPVEEASQTNQTVARSSTEQAPVASMTRTVTKVTTRSEATAAIDSICAYFEANEPASPVPLLLQRAKRLIPMSFVEILRELASNEANSLLPNLAIAEKATK